ncbi:MAG: F0F1 ATP synthase subunit B [Phycisphaeraceae bacterium]
MNRIAVLAPLVVTSLATPLFAAAEEGEATTPMAGTYYQSLAAVIVFLILLAVLYKWAWGPILSGLQDREGKIQADLASAERRAREANETLAQYQAQLAEARQEAQQMIERSREDARKVAADLRAQAEQEAAQLRERTQRDIETAKEQAITDIYDRTAELSTQIAARILQRQIRPEDQQALVQRSLDELARTERRA